jgi:hypothetical protein
MPEMNSVSALNRDPKFISRLLLSTLLTGFLCRVVNSYASHLQWRMSRFSSPLKRNGGLVIQNRPPPYSSITIQTHNLWWKCLSLEWATETPTNHIYWGLERRSKWSNGRGGGGGGVWSFYGELLIFNLVTACLWRAARLESWPFS